MRTSAKVILSGVAALGVLTAAWALPPDVIVDTTVTASVGEAASLTISPTTVTFPSADPGTVASIPNSEGAISMSARTRIAANVDTIVLLESTGDLSTGGATPLTIGSGNVSYALGGANFSGAATMVNSPSQRTLGSFTGPGVRTGTISYALANSYAYQPGTYTTTFRYTLTTQ
jgi:hypothetical protein